MECKHDSLSFVKSAYYRCDNCLKSSYDIEIDLLHQELATAKTKNKKLRHKLKARDANVQYWKKQFDSRCKDLFVSMKEQEVDHHD